MNHKNIGMAFMVVCVSGWALAQPTESTQANDYAASIERIKSMTHTLVCEEAFFDGGIPELLPKGVRRMTSEELSALQINSADGSVLSAEAFMIGKTTSSELKVKLGRAEAEKMEPGKGLGFDYSYNAADGAMVVYIFDRGSVLKAIRGYSNSISWNKPKAQ